MRGKKRDFQRGQRVKYAYYTAAMSCQSVHLVRGAGRIRHIDNSNAPHIYDVSGVMVSAKEIQRGMSALKSREKDDE